MNTYDNMITLADGLSVPLFADGTVGVYCKRCGGSGRYNWCQRWADMCFGCEGKGVVGREPREEAERKAVNRKKAAERAARKIAEKAEEQKRVFAEWASARTDLVEALQAIDRDNETWAFLRDLAERVQFGWTLSEAQEQGVRKALETRKAQEQNRAEEKENAVAVPEGRLQVEGEILTIKEQESQYGITVKMLVRDDRGFKVWGTLPLSLGDVDKGSRVRFVARLQRSEKDETFGFFSRPTKAEDITEKS